MNASTRVNLLQAQDDIAEANVILGRAARALRVAGLNVLGGDLEVIRLSLKESQKTVADVYCEKVTA